MGVEIPERERGISVPRESVVTQMRIRDESRFIAKSLARTYQIAQTVVIFDDNSTDQTENCCIAATVGMELFPEVAAQYTGQMLWILDTNTIKGYRGERRILHYIRSPFANCVRPKHRIDETRDKFVLWKYLTSSIEFEICICLDGDEVLSRAAIRHFDTAIEMLNKSDILEVPVLYLWDSEDRIRVDGCYGRLDDSYPIARHPRIFTIKRLSEEQLFMTNFKTSMHGASFHCGSVPQEGWNRIPTRAVFPHPIVHFGYIDRALRERKYEFYHSLDGANEREGNYAHIIEKQNHLCPGPPRFETWTDE